MRRYKLAIHILVTLSIFNFVSVLAAPITAQEGRTTLDDVADEGKVVTIVQVKRGKDENLEDPWSESFGSMESISLSTPPSEHASMFNHDFKWTPNTEIEAWTPEQSQSEHLQEEDKAQTTTVTEQPKPSEPDSESKSVLGNLAQKAKGFWRQVTSVSKSLFSEMVDNPKLQIH
jgi:hypothetical protein